MAKNKDIGVHLSKMPEWMYDDITRIKNNEARSLREVGMILVAAALKEYKRHGCGSITDLLRAWGIEGNPLENGNVTQK